MVAECLARFKRVDVLINNVGGTIWAKPFEHYEEAQIEAEIRRSLFPTLWCCRAVLPFMVKKKKGVIVNVSSIATRSVHRVPYAAARAASMRSPHRSRWSRRRMASASTPPPRRHRGPPRKVPRNTAEQSKKEKAWYQAIVDQTRDSSLMHRYGSIDEQVAPILFFASDESSYITGSVLPVGGGDLG